MAKHSIIGPSRAPRIVPCPGSVQMEVMYEQNRDRTEADEGNLAHDYAAITLQGGTVSQDVPSEMAEAVRLYYNDVMRIVEARRLSTDFLFVEHRVEMPQIHNDCFGTLDSGIYDPKEKVLIIWDFKYGWGIVDEWENWQTFWYALGLLRFYKETKKVHVRIVQPRPYCHRGRIREWTFGVGSDRFIEMVAMSRNAAHLALSENPPLKAGAHCRNCQALLNCPAALKSAQYALDTASSFRSISHGETELSRELDILETAQATIKHRISVIRERITAGLKAGGRFPGWGLESVPGRTVWDCSIREAIGLGKLAGIDIRKEDVITPFQARDKKVPWDLIKMYTKTPTALKLVRDDGQKYQQLLEKEK